MDNDLLEELIRIEAEELAEEISGADYCQLTPEHRHLLRLRAIDRLELILEDGELKVKSDVA